MAVEPGQGIDQSLAKGGFETVKNAVKGVIREGWSAGQVLEQVRKTSSSRVYTDIRCTTLSSRLLLSRPYRSRRRHWRLPNATKHYARAETKSCSYWSAACGSGRRCSDEAGIVGAGARTHSLWTLELETSPQSAQKRFSTTQYDQHDFGSTYHATVRV